MDGGIDGTLEFDNVAPFDYGSVGLSYGQTPRFLNGCATANGNESKESGEAREEHVDESYGKVVKDNEWRVSSLTWERKESGGLSVSTASEI